VCIHIYIVQSSRETVKVYCYRVVPFMILRGRRVIGGVIVLYYYIPLLLLVLSVSFLFLLLLYFLYRYAFLNRLRENNIVYYVCAFAAVKVNIFLQCSSFRMVGQMHAHRCNAIKYIYIYNVLSCTHFKIINYILLGSR